MDQKRRYCLGGKWKEKMVREKNLLLHGNISCKAIETFVPLVFFKYSIFNGAKENLYLVITYVNDVYKIRCNILAIIDYCVNKP